ncbi:MAG: hypothetical protein R3223_06075 [Longimicrobiales bacterium]|nr:hypothetical protein [Longimicrobiales bacterium]
MTPFELGRGPRERETCIRCLEQKDATDVDRRKWCRECRERARERAKSEGWKAGAVFAAFLALYIWIFVGPSTLILGAWIASVVAAFWLVSKIAREVHYGIARYRNEPAVEATPPVDSGEEGDARNDGPSEEGGSEESTRQSGG